MIEPPTAPLDSVMGSAPGTVTKSVCLMTGPLTRAACRSLRSHAVADPVSSCGALHATTSKRCVLRDDVGRTIAPRIRTVKGGWSALHGWCRCVYQLGAGTSMRVSSYRPGSFDRQCSGSNALPASTGLPGVPNVQIAVDEHFTTS